MAQINISAPEGPKKWAEQHVAEGPYSSTSDQTRRAQDGEAKLAELQAAIDKGRASGVDPRPVSHGFDEIMAKSDEKR